MASPPSTPSKILIINPNTTRSMTTALVQPIQALSYKNTEYTYHTNTHPQGPSSINNPADASLSTTTILSSLRPLISTHDAFLVACFSPHPLVNALRDIIASSTRPGRVVVGIFEAGVLAGARECERMGEKERWGIVTTGEEWRESLSRGVGKVCGFHGVDEGGEWEWDYRDPGFVAQGFGGVETTGLNAGELHCTGREVVDCRMAEALGRLIDFWREKGERVGVVVLGCAGMVGWEEKVLKEMRRRFPGGGDADEAVVIDPVKAGVEFLQNAMKAAH